MDNAQSGAGDIPPRPPSGTGLVGVDFSTMTNEEYQQLDVVVREVLAGGRSNEDNPLTPAARRLLAPVQLQDWAALTDPIFGEISPARILALRALAHTKAVMLRANPLAPWIGQEPLVGVRFCDVQPGLAGWSGGSMAEARQLIIGELMRIDGLGAAATFDWQTIKGTIRIEGELSGTSASNVWTVLAVIPQGPWIPDLLTGTIALTTGAYAVPAPNATYIEVALDSRTTLVLKGLWRLLGLDSTLFRGLLRHALGQKLGAEMIGVRVTTSAFSHGGEGKKGKTTFPPDHSDSKIVFGVEATLLLQAGRIGPTLALGLGCYPTYPITIQIPCPETPGYALHAMRSTPDCTAIRYRVPGALPTTRDVVMGYVGVGVDITQTGAHLPAGWISDRLVNSQAHKSWALQLLRQAFQREVGATTMIPVGRLKKGGGDPAYLFVMFPTVDAAAKYCALLDASTLPPGLKDMLSSFLGENGRLATFCAYIPPEAIESCNEKDVVHLFKAGLTGAAVINQAAPNAEV